MTIPQDYSHKTVTFRWNRQELYIRLSHGLFSSFDIDSGTRLLLKSLVETVDFDTLHSVLDVGCGTGVIGACIGRRSPGTRIVMQDRDALAVAFSRENCRENGVMQADIRGALALTGIDGETFDLVVTNFPAKAGAPVLQSFIRGVSRFLTPGGRVAIVIVTPLAEAVEAGILAAGGVILHSERTPGYAVFHFTTPPAEAVHELPVYLRTAAQFTLADVTIALETVYGLPDFDTPSYSHHITAELLRGWTPSGKVLFWNPGQGLIPVYLLERLSGRQKERLEFHLADNDLLSLAVTGRNLETRHAGVLRNSLHLPFEAELRERYPEASFDAFVIDLQPIPGVHWQENLSETAGYLLKKDGKLILMGKTALLTAFEKNRKNFRAVDSGKFRGFRSSLLKKT